MLQGRGGRPIDLGACRRPIAARLPPSPFTWCLLSPFHCRRYDPRVMRHVLFTETKLK